MSKTWRKALKILFIILGFILAVVLAVDLYLTYRLEGYLRKRLGAEVSKATDGFYSFTFDKLSVGFFRGELSIQGASLRPDSTTFAQWKASDSLPDTYVDIHIGEINLKGLNLIWRLDYKDLDFALFEIRHPDVKIFNIGTTSDNKSKESQNRESKTLYEQISPYLNFVSVKKINLEGANISYRVGEGAAAIDYRLRNADFHAYGFLLDKNSAISGRLLYCDNFDFTTNTPQQLLSSSRLLLNIDHIKLSTTDSLIHIEGVRLHPQAEHWGSRTTKSGNYVKAEVKDIDIKGIDFTRIDAHKYLDAGSFDIRSADIEYYIVNANELKKIKTSNTNKAKAADWSFYNIISPIFSRISIKKMGMEQTRFSYNVTHSGQTDVYTMSRFNFTADDFMVDSLSEKRNKYLYVKDFSVEALDLKGLLRTKNTNISVDRFYLSTRDSLLSVSDISMAPIAENGSRDYQKGTIALIEAGGLTYEKGIGINRLRISDADISYFRSANEQQTKQKLNRPESEDRGNVAGLIPPYADYLSIRSIVIDKSAFTFHNKKNRETYYLKNIRLGASDFLIDGNTRKNSDYLFTCNSLKFSFSDFDNYLPGKAYRLQIKEGELSYSDRKISLRDIRFTPYEKSKVAAPDTYINLSASALQISGFDDMAYIKNKRIEIAGLDIKSPHLNIIKFKQLPEKKAEPKAANNDLASIISALELHSLKIIDADLKYSDKISHDSLQAKWNALSLKSLKWDMHDKFTIDEIRIQSPAIDYLARYENKTAENKAGLTEKPLNGIPQDFYIGKFSISDMRFNFKEPDFIFSLKTKLLDWEGLSRNTKQKESAISLASVNIINPVLSIHKNDKLEENETIDTTTVRKDIYEVLKPYADTFSVGDFNILNAHVDYARTLDRKDTEHKTLNSTNLNIEKLNVNTASKKWEVDDVRLNTKDLRIPVMDGFYTIAVGSLDIRKKEELIQLDHLHMVPLYPKTEFAYQHPRNKDWFDVTVGQIILSSFDYPAYLNSKELLLDKMLVSDVVLQNYKNQKIEIQHNIMPMIYEGIQKLPLKFSIKEAKVANMSVIYEELTKNGTIPGKIFFTEMNGDIEGLTNMVTRPDQYIQLDADGKLMGTGYFTARWDIPVDSLNDHFMLEAHVHSFYLTDLNQLITPMAPAQVKSGMLKDLKFRTDASSQGAVVEMLFLYNDLQVTVFRNADTGSSHRLFTRLANSILKTNNPKNEKSKPRQVHVSIVRNPYHSTFNYFWQILQPPLVESVGFSQRKQNLAKKTSGFFGKVKGVFKKDKKKTKELAAE